MFPSATPGQAHGAALGPLFVWRNIIAMKCEKRPWYDSKPGSGLQNRQRGRKEETAFLLGSQAHSTQNQSETWNPSATGSFQGYVKQIHTWRTRCSAPSPPVLDSLESQGSRYIYQPYVLRDTNSNNKECSRVPLVCTDHPALYALLERTRLGASGALLPSSTPWKWLTLG